MELQSNPYRQTKRVVVLGAPGTGKTTVMHRILHASGQKALVITPYLNEWNERDANGAELYPELQDLRTANLFYQGIRRHVFLPNYTLEHLNSFVRGTIVYDDCRAYFKATLDQKIHAQLMATRQNMVDIFAIGHGFREVPPVFFTFATEYILFRTEDNLDRRASDIRNIDKVREMQALVNRNAVQNPFYFKWFKV